MNARAATTVRAPFRPELLARLRSRSTAVRQLADSLGGSVECIYWMFGTHDGLVITDAPDSIGAAA